MFSGFWWKLFTEFANSFGRPQTQAFSVNKLFIQKAPVPRQCSQSPQPGVVHGSNPTEGFLPTASACADTVYPRKAAEMLGLIIRLGHI